MDTGFLQALSNRDTSMTPQNQRVRLSQCRGYVGANRRIIHLSMIRKNRHARSKLGAAGSDGQNLLACRAQRHGYGGMSMNDSAHFRARARSEEHTSELQSRLHLVCRLL